MTQEGAARPLLTFPAPGIKTVDPVVCLGGQKIQNHKVLRVNKRNFSKSPGRVQEGGGSGRGEPEGASPLGVPPSRRTALLNAMYSAMYGALGPSGWWPAQSPFEVMAGAVLTQGTAWGNVEKAIAALRAAGCLEARAMHGLAPEALEGLIRPAGFFRVKARRLRALLDWLYESCGYELEKLRGRATEDLRRALLGVKGIGPETADCILCYALERPSFVVDAYTRRIFSRHALVPEDVGYEELRAWFMEALPPDTRLFNEYHGLIVRVAKEFCRKREKFCERCPLGAFLYYPSEL